MKCAVRVVLTLNHRASIRPQSDVNTPTHNCNAVFGRSRRWGPIPAKGEAT